MVSKRIEIANDEALVGTQLQVGKQVLKALFDLFTNEGKDGIILPIELNGRNFSITIEEENND